MSLLVKNPSARTGDLKRDRFSPLVGKSPWRKAPQPTPVFFPGESHGQKSLPGYSPRSCKELDSTEANQHMPKHTQGSGTVSRSVLSDSLRPHGLWPARLLYPWDSSGNNAGMGCHSLLQGSSRYNFLIPC